MITADDVFCLAIEIAETKVFQYEDKQYRRLREVSNPLKVMACITQEHFLVWVPVDANVRRCNDFGDPMITPEEMEEIEGNSERYGRAMDAIDERVRRAIMDARRAAMLRPLNRMLVDYSAYESDANEVPIDNLDEIAVNGKVKFVSNNPEWEERPYESEVMENPTWLQVAVLANDMILWTKDRHHRFLECVTLLRRYDDVAVYEFGMGS